MPGNQSVVRRALARRSLHPDGRGASHRNRPRTQFTFDKCTQFIYWSSKITLLLKISWNFVVITPSDHFSCTLSNRVFPDKNKHPKISLFYVKISSNSGDLIFISRVFVFILKNEHENFRRLSPLFSHRNKI